MTKLFVLEIYTPNRIFFKDSVESVTVETLSGRRGFLAGACPMLCSVVKGRVDILHNKKRAQALCSDGFLQVQSNRIVLLCDHIRWPHEAEEVQGDQSQAALPDHNAVRVALAEKLSGTQS